MGDEEHRAVGSTDPYPLCPTTDSGVTLLKKAADLLLSAAADQEHAGRLRLAASHRARAAALLDELSMIGGAAGWIDSGPFEVEG